MLHFPRPSEIRPENTVRRSECLISDHQDSSSSTQNSNNDFRATRKRSKSFTDPAYDDVSRHPWFEKAWDGLLAFDHSLRDSTHTRCVENVDPRRDSPCFRQISNDLKANGQESECQQRPRSNSFSDPISNCSSVYGWLAPVLDDLLKFDLSLRTEDDGRSKKVAKSGEPETSGDTISEHGLRELANQAENASTASPTSGPTVTRLYTVTKRPFDLWEENLADVAIRKKCRSEARRETTRVVVSLPALVFKSSSNDFKGPGKLDIRPVHRRFVDLN